MARYLVVSASLDPNSVSRRMCKLAFTWLQKAKVDCEWIDLRDLELPFCDADECYAAAGAKKITKAVQAADGILVGVPVYNYDVSASAKNMVELTGSAWEEKVVGFLCAAGGANSYMSVMAFANSLMLDFRSVIIPRFVYAIGDAFEGDSPPNKQIVQRIEQVAAELVRFTKALRG